MHDYFLVAKDDVLKHFYFICRGTDCFNFNDIKQDLYILA